jgi:hypothetical protein
MVGVVDFTYAVLAVLEELFECRGEWAVERAAAKPEVPQLDDSSALLRLANVSRFQWYISQLGLIFVHSDPLMEECVRVMQHNLRSSSSTMRRAKSVYSQNSLGTIKQRKKEKKKESKNQNSDVILRILRMRYTSYHPLVGIMLIRSQSWHSRFYTSTDRYLSYDGVRTHRSTTTSPSSVKRRRKEVMARFSGLSCPPCPTPATRINE